MKKIIFFILLQYTYSDLFCQVLKKYPVDVSGCAAYFYCNPGNFDFSYSPDSSKVYTAECNADQNSYGVICVKFKDPTTDINSSEEVLVAYLDFLKTNFKITTAAGYGKGHRLRGNEKIHGIVDYWKDEEKNNWKIKGWTNGSLIVIMYVYSKQELPEAKVNVFLDGIVFPE
jgi:hypothetical protein